MAITLKRLTEAIDVPKYGYRKNVTAGATGDEVYDLATKAHICYPPNALQVAGIYNGHIATTEEEHEVQLFYNIHSPRDAGCYCLTCKGQCKHSAAVFFKWYYEVVIPKLGIKEEKRTYCQFCADRLPGAEETNIERWERQAEALEQP